MKQKEVVGTLFKEESMEILTSEALPKTLVFHIINPYPGFHGDSIPESAVKPDNIFFITKKVYSWEKIIRTNNKIKSKTRYKNLDASFATVLWGKTKFFAIRVHHIPSYDAIDEVQELFAQFGGFEYEKRGMRSGEKMASIKLTKFFEYEVLEDKIFKDLKRQHVHYIEFQEHIRWEEFAKITYAIKNEIENRNFDAALATFFKNENVFDAVRIYKPGMDEKQLLLLKRLYEEKINNLHL